MWHEVDLHGLHNFERMVGFSVPVEGELAIIAYDGIHLLDLHEPESVRQDTAHLEGGHLYDQTRQVLSYGGREFPILGVFGGSPLVRNQREERLILPTTEDVLYVRDMDNNVILAYPFEDLAGDWRYATFSRDGDAIVLGMPYDIHIFQTGKT
jgi:hypothetical protein